MTPMHRRLLYTILTGYVLLATIYSIVTPIFEASDELWHYPMVKYLADNGLQLPPQDPANPGPWRQEGSQPPLYYMLAAILTAGIDTSDMDYVRRINPHADIGVVLPDGNVNMIVHRAEAESFPWRGTVLAVHIARFFSIALGLGTVIVTYLLAREIFPDNPTIILGATALNAFLPMFLFISGSVNNDNLSNLLGNWLTLLIVRLLKSTISPGIRTYLLLGLITGAGLLAKFNIGFLIPLVALVLLIVSWRLRNWKPLVIGGAIAGGLTIAIAGWWYLRNMQLYGDPTGLNRFLEMVGKRAIPANVAQLWSERHSFTQAYWGFFGGVNVPLPDLAYLIFNIIGGIGLIGAVIFIIYAGVNHLRTKLKSGFSINWLPAAITLIWPIITFISYLRWTAETPASQGRLVFAALSSISLWMVVGLVWWLPVRFRPILMSIIAGYFAIVATLTPFLVIAPSYSLPDNGYYAYGAPRVFSEPNNSGGQIILRGTFGSLWFPEVPHPEDFINVLAHWDIKKPLNRDWSLFAHLVTPDGVIIGQRDVYPGRGLLATSDLEIDRRWINPIKIWIPPTAYAPMTLSVEIGWYDIKTGERMRLEDGAETLNIGSVKLMPRPDPENLGVENPIRINFGDEIELVGYKLTDLSPAVGDAIELTLYWRGLRSMTTDYKVFANIIDPATLTKYAASDGMPVNWQAPTSTWTPGTIIEDTHTLTVDPNAPPGIYELEIGLYAQTPNGNFERLRIITPDGGMATNFLYLSRVRILPMETP
ncbi:MAG: glycosyltransferase family 39 protein [Anaerolineae bacterium]|nr:glycosyltransferase family 39 protein [Anaerolineae bacterium]